MRSKASPRDLFAALATTLLGGLLLFLTLRARWDPLDMNPGVEGCLTAGVIGTILLLLARIPYQQALLFASPVLALEYWAVHAVGGPAVGVVAIHLIVIGFIGLAISPRNPQAEAEGSPASGPKPRRTVARA